MAMRQVGASLGPDLASLLVLRPDAFWDKQRVDACARAQRQGEVSAPPPRVHACTFSLEKIKSCTQSRDDEALSVLALLQPVLIPLSRLQRYMAPAQIPEELGGPWVHNHHQWIQNRIVSGSSSGGWLALAGAGAALPRLRSRSFFLLFFWLRH